MYRHTTRWAWTMWIVLLIALAGCFDLSREKEEPGSLDSPLPTPTAEPGVIVLTPGEDRREPTGTPWPTATPRPTPTRRPGPTATPFPTRKPAADASGSIYYAVNKDIPVLDNVSVFHPGQVVYRLPVDETGLTTGAATTLPLPTDITLILDSVSPNGHYALLLEPSEPGGIPYILDVSSERIWPLFKEYPWAGGRSFAWHPDGRHLLFWSLDVAMWLVDAETEEYTILSYPDGPIQGAAISPDGQSVVFIASGHSDDYVAIASTAGSDERPLIEPVDAAGIRTIFSWSPDGQHILYAGSDPTVVKGAEPAGGVLFLMDANGQNRRPLQGPFIYGWGFEPVWSSNGSQVAYVGSNADEAFGCAQKGGPAQETDPLACSFVGTSIYVEDIYTGEVLKLTDGTAPVWSPDGSIVSFLTNRSGTSELWAINADGTGLRQLTQDGEPKFPRLAWTRLQE